LFRIKSDSQIISSVKLSLTKLGVSHRTDHFDLLAEAKVVEGDDFLFLRLL
jgi:hypothetical protein